MKVAGLGRTQWLYDSILACAAAGHEIVLIGTSPSEPEYSVTEKDFENIAKELKCLFFCDKIIDRPEYIQMIETSKAEVAISVNWQTVIGSRVLGRFEFGIINAHAGDLPRFKGNACPNWAILTGEEKVVLTLHLMDESLDGGAIVLQREFPLSPCSYIGDIYQFVTENISQMFVQVLSELSTNTTIPRKQLDDATSALRCFPRRPQDGEMDWNCSAMELSRLVRANAEPFSGAYTFLGTEKIIIWRAHPETLPYKYYGYPGQVAELRQREGHVTVLTGEGVLVLEEIEWGPGKRGAASRFIKSTRWRFGLCLSEMLIALNRRVSQLEMKLDRLSKEPRSRGRLLLGKNKKREGNGPRR